MEILRKDHLDDLGEHLSGEIKDTIKDEEKARKKVDTFLLLLFLLFILYAILL